MDGNANYCDSLFSDLWKTIPVDPHNSFPFWKDLFVSMVLQIILLFLFLKWKIPVLYAVL